MIFLGHKDQERARAALRKLITFSVTWHVLDEELVVPLRQAVEAVCDPPLPPDGCLVHDELVRTVWVARVAGLLARIEHRRAELALRELPMVGTEFDPADHKFIRAATALLADPRLYEAGTSTEHLAELAELLQHVRRASHQSVGCPAYPSPRDIDPFSAR